MYVFLNFGVREKEGEEREEERKGAREEKPLRKREEREK
jgi:hypothetical protein